MLLHHVCGPTSFNDLKKYNTQYYPTFREACEARGLLEIDNHWDVTLEEAAQCRSAGKMRELFAVLVATCGLSNPQQLWDKYKNYMTDDILHRLQEQNPNVTYSDLFYNEGLTKIVDQVKTISGKDLSDYGMIRPQRTEEISSDLIRELDYDTASLQQQLTESVPRLNPEQRLVFDNVVKKIEDGEGGLLFLDTPGGTGKTFLLNLLLAQIRKDKGIAVAVASSGIAATLLNGGRTAHSVLKLPLNLAHEEMPVCNISKNSERGRMLQQCKLLVWDECTMSHKRAIEALDRTLKDIKSNPNIMGGMVVLLAGDFRQTLPVITKGTPADEINACLKASTLWVHVKTFSLSTNMRVQLHNDVQSGQYAAALLKIGEDRMAKDVSIQEEIPSTSQERQPTLSQSYTTVSIQEEIPSTSQERQPTLSESYTTVFVQEEMPGTIQERYPIPIEAYATVSIQEEMPGTSEERQPTLSESYTTVFAQEEMAGTSPERQPIPSESYATEVPVLTIPEEFDIVETDFTEIDKQPLVYISGYIASTVVKSLNCVVCEQALQENNPENNPIYSYITLREWWKDQHALTYPSIKLCGLIQDALDILKRSN
ncbi:ATP-dependent DNA helicase pif1 [Eumeta japonica]|uniref:ATP-dependent DNA helicase n=1 Tax=Eumeta variegata TaxID=151549 RepID=A0A4C1SBR5_EUMVA|nr:ATP-dependent DNA helicase pif1 [Eumeta japonica]